MGSTHVYACTAQQSVVNDFFLGVHSLDIYTFYILWRPDSGGNDNMTVCIQVGAIFDIRSVLIDTNRE